MGLTDLGVFYCYKNIKCRFKETNLWFLFASKRQYLITFLPTHLIHAIIGCMVTVLALVLRHQHHTTHKRRQVRVIFNDCVLFTLNMFLIMLKIRDFFWGTHIHSGMLISSLQTPIFTWFAVALVKLVF